MPDKIVTANRLGDGSVVYLAPEGRWCGSIEDALVVAQDAVEPLLAMAERAVRDRLVVSPYAIDVERTAGLLHPGHIKEVIRAKGPTVRRDLGKQAVASGSQEAAHVPL